MELSFVIVACCLLGQATSADPGSPKARKSKARTEAPRGEVDPEGEPAGENAGGENENENEKPSSDPDDKTSEVDDKSANSAANSKVTGDENHTAVPAAKASTEDEPLVPVTSDAVKQGAAEALIRQLALPSEAPVPGRPVTLAEALSRSVDRRRQTEIAHAY